jgi:phosphoribosylglycinamide formyltransferase-1
MIRIAIFASGRGSNAEKIIQHFKDHDEIDVSLIVSNHADAGVTKIANAHQIPTLIIKKSALHDQDFLLSEMQKHDIGFIVLAGFMLLIPAFLVKAYEGNMINIHPALLPKFGGKGMYGMHVHEAVKKAGESTTGITIHFVNEKYDEGAIIFQASVNIGPTDTPEHIAEKVHILEHKHYPEVIERLLVE